MAGFNANFRNSGTDKDYALNRDPGHGSAATFQVVPPQQGLNEISCGETVQDALTETTFKSLFRFDDIIARQRYYSVLFSFRIDEVSSDVLLKVRSTSFRPFITIWRNATHRFEVDPEQSSANEFVVPIDVTADITGPFILEVTSEEPYQTGDFEVELVCEPPVELGQFYYKMEGFTPSGSDIIIDDEVNGSTLTTSHIFFETPSASIVAGKIGNALLLDATRITLSLADKFFIRIWFRYTGPNTFDIIESNGTIAVGIDGSGDIIVTDIITSNSINCGSNGGTWHRLIIMGDPDNSRYKVKLDNAATQTIATSFLFINEFRCYNVEIDEIYQIPGLQDFVPTDAQLLTDWNSGAGLTWPAADMS